MLTIFLVIFIDLVGFGMIIPILPYYAVSYGASATQLGVLMMCYSGMQFLFSPFWGRLSDRLGRRPVLLVTVLGIAASMLVLGKAPSLSWLFIARLLAGFFGANISTAAAYIADMTTPEKRAKGMGMIGAAFGLGFLFGPALGGFLSHWGYGTVAFAVAGMALLNFVFALFSLKEPERHHAHCEKKRWFKVLSEPKTGVPIFLFFLVTLGLVQVETTFALFLMERFGLGPQPAGYLLAGMAVVLVLIQGGGIGRLARDFGERHLVMAGTILMSLALVAAGLSFNLGYFALALLFHAIGYGITNPSLSSLASRAAAAGGQGEVMGIYQSAGSLARVLGPLLAGWFFEHLGASVPFWSAAAVFMSAGLFSFTLFRAQIKKPEDAPSS